MSSNLVLLENLSQEPRILNVIQEDHSRREKGRKDTSKKEQKDMKKENIKLRLKTETQSNQKK